MVTSKAHKSWAAYLAQTARREAYRTEYRNTLAGVYRRLRAMPVGAVIESVERWYGKAGWGTAMYAVKSLTGRWTYEPVSGPNDMRAVKVR